MLIDSSSNISCGGTTNANSDKSNFPNTLNQYKIKLWGRNTYGFGIAGSTLQYSSQGNHAFYNNSKYVNSLNIDSSCNVSSSCIGNTTINRGILTLNTTDWSTGGSKGIIFRSGYDAPNNNKSNCRVVVWAEKAADRLLSVHYCWAVNSQS